MVEYPMILILHRTVSIVLIILLAIHIYIYIYISFIEDLPLHNVTAFMMLKVDDR